jgi:hypothetical protein
MKYPFHTQSMPVVGQEAERLLITLDSDSYVTNEAAEATLQRIVERRKARELADVASR